MRRLVVPLLVAAGLVIAQGALVLGAGAPSLAQSPARGVPVSGAGGAGDGVGAGSTVDVTADRLDGSAGIAHLASIASVRSLGDTATTASPASAQRAGLPYSYPVRWGTPISGKFGAVSSFWPRGHAGMDFDGETGDPVYAATDGRVQYAEYNYGGYGNLIMIMRKDGTQTRYAHLSKIKVRQGQRVQAGDRIGTVGSTGQSTGAHLHFEVRVGRGLTPTDPAGLWTGSQPGIPAKPPKWACRSFGGC
jgi:murein DD-endopeptidase MepM/ murein hydrolase activator NlpD